LHFCFPTVLTRISACSHFSRGPRAAHAHQAGAAWPRNFFFLMCARTLTQFKRLRFEIITYPAPQNSKQLSASSLNKLLQGKGLNPPTLFRNIDRGVFAQEYRKPRYIHCEVQVLRELLQHGAAADSLSYIGISRKCCFLCSHFLRLMRFETRGSHGKVYPHWTAAVPSESSISAVLEENMAFALGKVEELVVSRLLQPKSGIVMVAESSAAVTAVQEDASSVNKLKKAALEKARQQQQHTDTPTSSYAPIPPQPTVYKQYSRAKVLRLPADGSAPTILSVATIDLRNEKSDRRGTLVTDSWLYHVPDLRRYWGQYFKTRDSRRLEITNNVVPALNGQYVVHFITDDAFPRNKTVSTLIRSAIEAAIRRGEVFQERLFWCGDVFVTRLGDSECLEGGWSNYVDLPKETLQMPPAFTLFFQGSFQEKFLEKQQRDSAAN
jgi:hypothetical protein